MLSLALSVISKSVIVNFHLSILHAWSLDWSSEVVRYFHSVHVGVRMMYEWRREKYVKVFPLVLYVKFTNWYWYGWWRYSQTSLHTHLMHSTADCGPSVHTIWVDPTVIKDITDIHRANTHCSPGTASMWYTHTDPHKQSRTQSHTTVQPHHARSSKQNRRSPKIYPSAYSPITPHCSEHTDCQLLPVLNLAVKTVTQSVTELVSVEHPNEYTYTHCLHCCHGNCVDTTSSLCPHRGSLSCLNGRHSNSECMSVWLPIKQHACPE